MVRHYHYHPVSPVCPPVGESVAVPARIADIAALNNYLASDPVQAVHTSARGQPMDYPGPPFVVVSAHIGDMVVAAHIAAALVRIVAGADHTAVAPACIAVLVVHTAAVAVNMAEVPVGHIADLMDNLMQEPVDMRIPGLLLACSVLPEYSLLVAASLLIPLKVYHYNRLIR